MKRILYVVTSIVLALLLVSPAECYAAKKKKKKPSKVLSHVGVYAGAGYSNLLHDIPNANPIGGGNGMIGFQYFLSHKNHFNFHLGVEAMFFNSFTAYDDFQFKSKYYYNDPTHSNLEMDYLMNFSRYSEQHNHLSVNVPLMFGAGFDKFYFAVGAKFKYSLLGYTLTNTDVVSSAIDPEFIESLENLPTHNLDLQHRRCRNGVNLGMDIAATAEVGLVLDEWMPRRMTSYGLGRRKKAIHYRLGLFADYGIRNQNLFGHTDGLISFPNSSPGQTGGFVVSEKDMSNVHTNSLLTTKESVGSHFNTLVVGVKFSVLVQTSKTPAKPKKRTRQRPKVRNVEVVDNTDDLVCVIRDKATGLPIEADVLIVNGENSADTLFYASSEANQKALSGTVDRRPKRFVGVSSEGYFNYYEMFEKLPDTLVVELSPIKKRTAIILENLFFDTDKTIIKNTSAESLEQLYRLLVDNPDMKIVITGHTDNAGSSQYNIRLSEGRARAVYYEMIRRGIDAKRMKWRGKGEDEPIDTNATEEGRARNRRVEFKVQ